MGLDYSYNIICRRDQMWGVLDEAAKRSSHDFREQEAEFDLPERDARRPLRDIWKKELVIDGAPIRRIAMDTSLWFEPDDDIREWFAAGGYPDIEAQHSYIGSITIYVDALCVDVFETPLEECADVCIGFWAATTGMSLLFEKSLSIRKAFVEIAKSQDDTICAFKPTDEGADVFWFEGEEVEDVISDMYQTRASLVQQIKENRIWRVLGEQTRKMTDRQVFNQAIKSEDAMVRAAAVSFLGWRNPVNAKVLQEMLFKDADAEVRRRCTISLVKIRGKESLPLLIKALHDSSALVREEVCNQIDRIRPDSKIDTSTHLLPLIRDEDSGVRRAAIIAFYDLARAEHIPQLIEALEVEETRPYAAKALARLQAVEAVKPLCEALKKEQQRRIPHIDELAFALGELGDQSSVPLLIESLESLHFSSCTTRFWIVQALGKLGDAQAIPALQDATKIHNCESTREAEAAIKRIRELNNM